MDEAETALDKFSMDTAFANLFIAADSRLETANLTLDGERYWIQNIETVTSTAVADAHLPRRPGAAIEHSSILHQLWNRVYRHFLASENGAQTLHPINLPRR